MSIIVPQNYSSIEDLEKLHVHCVQPNQADNQDIRPLRVGILNIMPNLEGYEFNLLHPLGRSIIQVIPVWIKLKSHSYKSADPSHLEKNYITYEEAMETGLDGLIITGAAVGKIPFNDIKYWPEIQSIFEHARKNIVNTLGICWGGIALSHFLGLNRTFYPVKHFGVFKGELVAHSHKHPVIGGMDDVFDCPQSRYSKIDDSELERARDEGVLNLLARGEESGTFIYETTDHRFLMHLGHPEYNRDRIKFEALRDQETKRDDVVPPINFDMDKPLNTWRSHRNEFFSSWLKHLYLENKF